MRTGKSLRFLYFMGQKRQSLRFESAPGPPCGGFWGVNAIF